LKCFVCQKEFNPIRRNIRPSQIGVSCSIACRDILRKYRGNVWRECRLCGAIFMTHKCWVARGGGKYCSKRHSGLAKIVSNYERYCEICGEVFYRKSGKYCSRKCFGEATRERQLGRKSHLWKGGITPENTIIRESAEYAEWRKAVYARDNWTCQECGARGDYLHAHHVFPFAEFPEHRFDIWNGVTLCAGCHAEYHPQLRVLWDVSL